MHDAVGVAVFWQRPDDRTGSERVLAIRGNPCTLASDRYQNLKATARRRGS